MRIGHVGLSVFPPVLSRKGGAIQRRVLELARAQRAAGNEVVVASVGEETRTQLHDGVRIEFISCRTGLPLRHFEFQARAVELLQKNRVEVIHFHSQPEGALFTRGRVPTVLSYDYFNFRGVLGRKFPALYRTALHRFDQLLPCSDYCRETSSRFWELPAPRTRVLYNGVDLQQFRPDPEAGARMRRKYGLDGLLLLYVGRVCEQKGSDLLLEAWERLRRRRRGVELVIAGPIGQFDQEGDPDCWIERIREAGARYLGPIEEEHLAAIYNLADVFVMPTRHHEMFGMAVVEAQACGRPVVASDHGGLRETVPDGCGFRFPSGSTTELVTAIERLLDDSELRARCGAEARRKAARFAWNEIAKAADGAYAAARGARS